MLLVECPSGVHSNIMGTELFSTEQTYPYIYLLVLGHNTTREAPHSCRRRIVITYWTNFGWPYECYLEKRCRTYCFDNCFEKMRINDRSVVTCWIDRNQFATWPWYVLLRGWSAILGTRIWVYFRRNVCFPFDHQCHCYFVTRCFLYGIERVSRHQRSYHR